MRVLQINKFHYYRRGAERYYLNLSDLLAAHGHEVVHFAMAHPQNLPSPYQDFFSRRLDFDHPSYSWRTARQIGRVLWNREAQADLAELIQKTRPQLVHVHNIYRHLSPSILAVCAHFQLPVVMTVEDYQLLSPNYTLFSRGQIDECCKPRRYWRAAFHRCVKHSFGASAVGALESSWHARRGAYTTTVNTFITPSEFVRRTFLQWQFPAAHRMRVIPLFVAEDDFVAPRKSQGFALFAGALEESKGVEWLLRALAKEQITYPVRVAGDGPERAELEALASELGLESTVRFLGRLSPADLREQWRICTFGIVPSLWWEPFGLVAVEAMAAGKPVLASDRGALPEIVSPEAGRVFSAASTASFAAAFRELASDAQATARLGLQAQERARTLYSGDAHYPQIMNVYDALVS